MTNPIELDIHHPWSLINHCPVYQATAVRRITTAHGHRLFIKDETQRFNLGAFKALGGIYAVAAFLLDQWQSENEAASPLDPNCLFDEDLQRWAGDFTFVCASAGNHGMAVAKAAQLFGTQCRIYLAETVPEIFAAKLNALGAKIVRAGSVYEDSMQAAREDCEHGSEKEVLLADSSWPGYTKMPSLVMAGYTVLAEEMRRVFFDENDWPGHVFLQAGVGGLAAAVTYHIRHCWEVQPQITVVEPEAAPCLFESHRQGKLTSVAGPVSSMGRLDCKEASMLAFEVLEQFADNFVCISEAEAADAVLMLAEHGIATTPSGAAGVAALLAAQRLQLDTPANAASLAIVTEAPLQ